MNWLCMSCLYAMCMNVCHTYVDYAHIDIMIVVVHEVMVCGRYGHALVIVEMMFMYYYDYAYTCIVLICFLLQTSYPHQNYTKVC